jgi:[acyl-carrier-protein] S-malonyltransferase
MKSVLLFPGQGSQSVGMMNGFDSNVVKEVFDMGSDIFGEDLLDLITSDNDKINQTIYTQPIMFLSGYATYLLLKEKKSSLQIDYVAGHSLGEITAACVAGVFSSRYSSKNCSKTGSANAKCCSCRRRSYGCYFRFGRQCC